MAFPTAVNNQITDAVAPAKPAAQPDDAAAKANEAKATEDGKAHDEVDDDNR